MSDETYELANDDLDTLIEALEAWEQKDLSGEIMGHVIDSMLTRRGDGPMPQSVAEERQREKAERESAKKFRKERSILLRAKLLMIRDRRRSQHMVDEALRPHV